MDTLYSLAPLTPVELSHGVNGPLSAPEVDQGRSPRRGPPEGFQAISRQHCCPLCMTGDFALLLTVRSGDLCQVHRQLHRRWAKATRKLHDQGLPWVFDVLHGQLLDL